MPQSLETNGASHQLDRDFTANPIEWQIHELSEFLKPHDWKIGIDGPAASGKGTVVELFEQHLGIKRLSTGLMYRATAFALLMDHQYDFEKMSDAELTQYLKTIDIQFQEAQGENHVILHYHTQTKPDAIDLTNVLETPRINDAVSLVAQRTPVRDFLAPQQTKIIQESKQIVTEGRDMWCIARPPVTDLLFYVYASEEVLIQRELERQRKKAVNITEDQARISTIERNRNDIKHGKLLSTHQARTSGVYGAVIDTTTLTKGEVFLKMLHTMALHPKAALPPSLPSGK